jgi:hypothetical protein
VFGLSKWAKLGIGLLLVGALFLYACSSSSIPFVNKTRNIVNGIETIKPGGYEYIRFNIDGAMVNVVLSGTFTASGGSGNDIEVLVLDDINYTNWVNGHQAYVLYDSGKTTTGRPSVSINKSGTYYLIFNNNWSIISEKSVTTRFDLTWH